MVFSMVLLHDVFKFHCCFRNRIFCNGVFSMDFLTDEASTFAFDSLRFSNFLVFSFILMAFSYLFQYVFMVFHCGG